MEGSIDDFNNFGFSYGDSCEIVFSNGQAFHDVPCFNGYYVKTGEPVICAYPGNPHVLIAYNNGDPMWDVLGCKAGDSVTVTVTEPGKYIPVQESMNHEDL